MKSNLKEVLTLEIRDEAIKSLFKSVRTHFNKGKVPKTPHLTIRGPYSGHIPPNVPAEVAKTLGGNVRFRVGGVGRFDSDSEHVVYLNIIDDNEKLRKVWWKPDFPLKDFGFNPHITVFRGSKAEADRVFDFLEKQHIYVPITMYELRADTIGQRELEFA